MTSESVIPTTATASLQPSGGPAPRFRIRLRRRSLWHDVGFWLMIAGLLLNCLAGHWSDAGIPLPIDRGLLAVGFALEYLRARRAGVLPRPTTSAAVLTAAAVWAALSFVASPMRTQTGLFLLIDLYVIPTILFTAAPLFFGTRHRRFAFAASFAVFGIYLGFTAITQTLQLTQLVFPAYILDPNVGIHTDRARGPYAESVNNGLMLIFSGVLGGYLARVASSRRWRIVGGISVTLCAIGVALTLTRAIWLAAIAVLVIMVVALPQLRRRIPLLLVGAAAVAVVFVSVFPDFLTAATSRGEDLNPIYDRLNVNQAAGAMALQHPLFGVGWNQAGLVMSDYIRMGPDYPVTAAAASLIPHNVFLGRFAELGIIGASLWLASVVAALVVPILQRHRPGFGAWRLVLLGFTACWLIVANFGPVNYSQPQYLLYLVGGITAMGRAVVPTPWNWRPRREQEQLEAAGG